DVGGEVDLVEAVGHGEGELHQAHGGVLLVDRGGDLAVAVDDLRLELVLQLHDHLGADGRPSLGGVVRAAEPAAQALADGGDHVVHHQDGGQLPPGGVLRAAGGGPGGDAPHRGDHAAHRLQGRHAASDQQVDVVVAVELAHAAKAPQRSAV